ncbi:MAG: hypothetical protein IKI63_02180 [Clostridia bacterium]|nr:hypothetical protein [Clostridia bacterium]
MARYQKLSPDGQQIKDRLRVCVDNARMIEDLEEERRDLERMGSPEEAELRAYIGDLRREMEQQRSRLNQWVRDTEELTCTERRILRLRYLCASPWESIFCQLHRDRGSVYSSYRRALNKVAKHLS